MRVSCLALAIVLTAATAWSMDDTPENRSKEADRYLAASPPREMLEDMAERVAKTLPEGQRALFKDALTKHLDMDAFTKVMRDAMVKHFTADELKALADFYGSPVGKSAMKKFGAYMADIMPMIQAEVVKAVAKAQAARRASEKEIAPEKKSQRRQ